MKQSIILTAAAAISLGVASCSDPMDEITSLVFDRNLSPIELKANVQNRTNVRLSWTTVADADQYLIEYFANDSLTFAGEATGSITISPSQVPYTVTGLDGDTKYSFRVKSVTSTDASRDSKWSEAYAKTNSEQIFQAVAEEDALANSVTLRWPAGETAALITITSAAGETVTHQVTADEIAAGAATVDGLTPETEYTAVLTRANGVVRGTINFKTAIYLEANDVLVKEGENLAEILAGVPGGTRLVIEPGTYTLSAGEDASYAAGDEALTKNITFKGLRANNRPVIEGRFTISDDVEVAFDQVILDGANASGDQLVTYKAETTSGKLTFEGCDIKNYKKGLIYNNSKAVVNDIVVNNCIIGDVICDGGDFIDFRGGSLSNVTFTNNTVYNSGRSFFRLDAGVEGNPNIVFTNNTLNNIGSNNSNNAGIMNVRAPGHNIVVTDNIFTNSEHATWSKRSQTVIGRFANNIYFNVPQLTETGGAMGNLIVDTNGQQLDPQYKDVDNADFTVGNFDVQVLNVGDPRWLNAE